MAKGNHRAWLAPIAFATYAIFTLGATIAYLYLDGYYRAYYEIGIAPALDQLLCILPIALTTFTFAPLATLFITRRMQAGRPASMLIGLVAYPIAFIALFLFQFLLDNSYPTLYKEHTLREFLVYLVTKIR